MLVNVPGGTNAGHRKVKTLPMWACRCVQKTRIGDAVSKTLVLHPGERYSCPNCKARRPT